MSKFFKRLLKDPTNLTTVDDAFGYFEAEADKHANELKVGGQMIVAVSTRIAGVMEHVFSQLQEIESILDFLERKQEQATQVMRVQFSEHYRKALTDTMAEKYARNDLSVVVFAEKAGQMAYVRNRFLSLTKGLEILHYQLGNISRLRAAGFEDSVLADDHRS